MPTTDDKNSICSDDDKNEELEVKDKDGEDDDDNDDEEDDNEEEEDEEEEEEEEEDDDEEFDPAIIQFELLKNFLVDDEGTNVSTHLGSIATELRRLNKILLKKN